MGISTSRAGLYKPGGGSTGLILPDEPVDIDDLNSNFDKIDKLLGARSIPGASSYAGSMDGDLVFASDTDYLMRYSAADGKLLNARVRGGNMYMGTTAERLAVVAGDIPIGSMWKVTNPTSQAASELWWWTTQGWRRLSGEKTLWTGAVYPTNASHNNVNLNEGMSLQPNGLILRWSGYDTGAGATLNAWWQEHRISRAQFLSGANMIFPIALPSYLNTYARKELNILNDTTLAGLAANSAGDAARIVLREVIGF